MDACEAGCAPSFHDVVSVSGREIRVYRCNSGWYVESGSRGIRSRFLDEALEGVIGRLDGRALRAVVDTLDRELTAERDATGHTASRVLSGRPTTGA